MRAARPAAVTLVASAFLLSSCATPVDGASAGSAGPVVRTSAASASDSAAPMGVVATVGPLFLNGTAQPHGCTATVVASDSGDVVMTAAHCLAGAVAGTVFVPGYHGGQAPFGSWTVTAAYAPAGWSTGQDEDDDVAFLVLAPHVAAGVTDTVQQATGAVTVSTGTATGDHITVIAYNDGIDDAPVQCATTVYDSAGHPTFDCAGFAAGTSGAAWLTQTGAGWSAVGLIGGHQQGGCEDYTSYSPAFGSDVTATLLAAEHGAAPETLPVPAGDGC